MTTPLKTPLPPTPPKPTVGGMIKETPRTGGPRVKEKRHKQPRTPMCFRPEDYDKSLKIYTKCITGLEAKFKGQGDTEYSLQAFSEDVWKHLVDTGMDSVFYFVDPVDKLEKSIIQHHARFTLKDIKDAVVKFSGDQYDRQNLEWSERFLTGSIATSLQKSISKYSTIDMTGPELWMLIVQETQSNSVRALMSLANELLTMQLSKYPGENVKLCTGDIFAKCERLQNAMKLPEDVGITICNILSKCSVEDFRILFTLKRTELELKPQSVTYTELIILANQKYQSLIDTGDWKPAGAPKEDSILEGLNAKIDQLIQTGGRRDQARQWQRGQRNGSGGRDRGRGDQGQGHGRGAKADHSKATCYNCGKKGHISTNCPDKAAKDKNDDGWKTLPPKNNDPREKIVDGKTWHWCGTCGRWTLSHSTADRDKQKNPVATLAVAESESTSFVAPLSLRWGGI